ncbi:hypothetical protein KY290_027517 [Solanum tuberosum]|uniref:Uncharacterized protein n=1 Tax=Solanum tuberosum TaxID=4113 RepID=A0ABQ7UIJ7_SOLTU|nr:hypothetical protein KY285_026453 [Solanum tuberosum]KAH0748285.1 hypothetical protein KY290_027517 [Solanum tuberosum]
MDALCRIVEPIGYPLTMDKATSTKSIPTTAKLRVELDLAKQGRKESQGQTQNDGQQPTKTTEEVAPNHQATISETEKIQNEDEGWQVLERKKGKGNGSNKKGQNYKGPQHNQMHQQMEKNSQVHKEENYGMEIIEPQIEGEQTLINTI